MCQHQYAILRIANDHTYCPGDWDFVISTLKSGRPSHDVLSSVRRHTGASGVLTRDLPSYLWFEQRYDIIWRVFPFLIGVDSMHLSLSDKFSEYRWVEFDEIPAFDNLDYFADLVQYTGWSPGGPPVQPCQGEKE